MNIHKLNVLKILLVMLSKSMELKLVIAEMMIVINMSNFTCVIAHFDIILVIHTEHQYLS